MTYGTICGTVIFKWYRYILHIFSSLLFQSAEVFGCQIGRTGACVVEVLNLDCEELMAEVNYYNVTYRILS